MYTTNHEIDKYLESHTTPVDEVLHELTRHTYLTTYNPRMISGPVQGKFIEMICQMVRPNRILEIGTFTGYSTICMAKALPAGKYIDTIEVNDELQETIEHYTAKAGVSSKVNLIIGNALTVIPGLPHTYDLIYIDGEKKEYPQYLNLCTEKLNAGGFLIADNVLYYDNLTPESIAILRKEYSKELCVDDDFWQRKSSSRFGTLIFLKAPERFLVPIKINKKDRRPWVVLEK